MLAKKVSKKEMPAACPRAFQFNGALSPYGFLLAKFDLHVFEIVLASFLLKVK